MQQIKEFKLFLQDNTATSNQEIESIIIVIQAINQDLQDCICNNLQDIILFDVKPYKKAHIFLEIQRLLISLADKKAEKITIKENVTYLEEKILKRWFCLHKIIDMNNAQITQFIQSLKSQVITQD